jgi:hypothetical protein
MTNSTIELDLHNPQQWAVVLEARLQPFVKSWLTAGKKLTLTCRLQKRSSKQNRRYWSNGVLAQIATQAVSGGKLHSTENWHEVFKRMFIGVEELPNGQVIGKSSTGLTTAEFCEFSDKVEAYAQTDLCVHFIDLPVRDLR